MLLRCFGTPLSFSTILQRAITTVIFSLRPWQNLFQKVSTIGKQILSLNLAQLRRDAKIIMIRVASS